MNSTFFYNHFSLSPLRKEPNDASEMISQVHFGEVVKLISQQQNWMHISQLLDGYDGWLDMKFLTPLSMDEVRKWVVSSAPSCEDLTYVQSKGVLLRLPKGSLLPKVNTLKIFEIGANVFEVKSDRNNNIVELESVALTYLGAPYLWGGKTIFGIDCSGFSQMVCRHIGVEIPRDAHQQFEMGETIRFEDKAVGDFAFFINAQGKVHHVGMYMGNAQIIHAHGAVRIDQLTFEGILSKDTKRISHNFHGIRRFSPNLNPLHI